jgi:hypothetical protein
VRLRRFELLPAQGSIPALEIFQCDTCGLRESVPLIPVDHHVSARLRIGEESDRREPALGGATELPGSERRFYEGASGKAKLDLDHNTHEDYTIELMASADGLALCRAFMRIKNGVLRRRIIALIAQLRD